VFSKCVREPPAEPAEPEVQAPPLDWAKGSGCRVYELGLPNGTPRLVRGIYSPHASDSTPAIWKGDIAFARITHGSSVQAVYLWAHASTRLRRVGGAPNVCVFADRCELHRGVLAWVREMSLDSDLLAYQWVLPEAVPAFSAAEDEIRVDPLRASRQDAPTQVVSYSIPGGACQGEKSGSPDAIGASVLYISHESICTEIPEKQPFAAIGSYSAATRRYSDVRVSPGIAVAVAHDHSTTYWIRIRVAPTFKEKNPQLCSIGPGMCEAAPDDYSETCAPALSTCTLMETKSLARELKPG
jgi:hypothetical protein